MAELNLKQIVDRLNVEFAGDIRKLIFWYDDNGDFAEDIDSLALTEVKVYHRRSDNQFTQSISWSGCTPARSSGCRI